MSDNWLGELADWATIGQFILAIVGIFLTLRQRESLKNLNLRQIGIYVISGFSLAVPSFLIPFITLLIIQEFPNIADVVLRRTAGLATFLGISWGIIWVKYVLPFFAKRAAIKQ